MTEISRYEGEEGMVYDLAWSPDGQFLLTGSVNRLRLYEVTEDGALSLLDSVWSASRYNSVQWSADGAYALAPTGTELQLYAVTPGGALSLVTRGPEHSAELQRVALSPDGTQALSCDVAGVVHLYDLSFEDGSLTALTQTPAHERCTRVAWSPSGHLGLSVGHEGKLVLHRIEGSSLEVADVFMAEEETGEAIFGRDDSEVIAGSFGTQNLLWYIQVDASDRLTILETQAIHASGVGALEWSHEGTLLLTGAHDHAMRIMTRRGVGLVTLAESSDDGEGVHSARWSPEDRWVARTASQVDLLQILDVQACFGE